MWACIDRDGPVSSGRAADRDDRHYRDQIATEGTVAMALVNVAYRAVAFTRSVPEPNQRGHYIGLRARTYPI
ncbi:hypothetical protein Taro_005598 [Colocasia esculenta]|uniref:Uncharacterized protein n=1 Tax=Colocasia esculenta TaxID=4460 RepID=A0A843TTH5_COLES|nr:hypothetical protein [Colocasia esculenta]